MNSFDIILRPVITEKATTGEKSGKYQFFVRNHATKIDVKNAFKKLYGVSVSHVNMMRTAEKFRTGRTRLPTLKKSGLKKVIVTTKGKKTVDITKPKVKI